MAERSVKLSAVKRITKSLILSLDIDIEEREIAFE